MDQRKSIPKCEEVFNHTRCYVTISRDKSPLFLFIHRWSWLERHHQAVSCQHSTALQSSFIYILQRLVVSNVAHMLFILLKGQTYFGFRPRLSSAFTIVAVEGSKSSSSNLLQSSASSLSRMKQGAIYLVYYMHSSNAGWQSHHKSF